MAVTGSGMNRAIGTDDFWPSSGFHLLQRNTRGWLVPTDAWLARFLARPELALVPESCAAEAALHQALQHRRYGCATRQRNTEKVFNLAYGNQHRRTGGKADYHGMRYKIDQGAQTQTAQQQLKNTHQKSQR